MRGLLYITLCLLVFLAVKEGKAQVDSTNLELDKLTAKDVKNPRWKTLKVVSSSRFAQDLRDVTYNTLVITKEEIIENGYTTLVDVLKDLPGFKVSQPGSGLDGESFVSRGFYGNYYTKILINSIPIGPSVVGGMPIGAQLPIRQASRIEVIYGPAAAIYGSDALNGIINIITENRDKAVFADATISAGSMGFNNLNLTVGGKFGQGKQLINYNFWGGSTTMNDYNFIDPEADVWNPTFYDPSLGYLDSDYYTGWEDSAGFNELPSESRYLGADLSYRSFTLSYHYMYRYMHSAIGLNPLSAVYDFSNTFVGEDMNRLSLSYNKSLGRFTTTSNLSWLNYRMDPESNFVSVYNFHHAGPSFYYAASDDLIFDQSVSYKLSDRFGAIGGFNMQYSGNLPFTSYLDQPFDTEVYQSFSTDPISENYEPPGQPDPPGPGEPPPVIDEVMGPSGAELYPNPFVFQNYSIFGMMNYTASKFKAQFGARIDFNSEFENSINPRLALLYKVTEDQILRASVSIANKTPTSFYQWNSLRRQVVTGPDGDEVVFVPFRNNNLVNERLTTTELGLRSFFSENMQLNVAVYYNVNQDHISYAIDSRDPSNVILTADTVGYFSDTNGTSEMLGMETSFIWTDLVPAIQLSSEWSLSINSGTYSFPVGGGTIDDWPMQPGIQGKWRVTMRPTESLMVGVKAYYSGPWLARNAWSDQGLPEDELYNSGFLVFDLISRYKVNRYFDAFAKVRNLLDTEYAGIGATGSLYDLDYNPQLRRFVEMGLNFQFN